MILFNKNINMAINAEIAQCSWVSVYFGQIDLHQCNVDAYGEIILGILCILRCIQKNNLVLYIFYNDVDVRTEERNN